MPRRFIRRPGQTGGPSPDGDMPRSTPRLPRGRAEPAPPRGASPGERPFGENPGIMWRGGSLGGARSPRPDGKAVLIPRHFITRGGWPGGRGLMETCLGQAGPFLTGVRSPPLRGGQASVGGLAGESPGMARKAAFSEGRTLCACTVRQYQN